MDEILGLWPQFSFDSDMISEFHVAGPMYMGGVDYAKAGSQLVGVKYQP